MNAPQPSPAGTGPINPQPPVDDEINISAYLDILLDNKWLIAIVTSLFLVIGLAYALLTNPVYEADILIQVEDSSGASATQTLLGEASSLFDVKTPASGEIEILRSRMVVGRAVDGTKYFIDAAPKYIPIIGGWLSRKASDLSDPGFLGFKGYVSGVEKIVVPQFDVPSAFEGTTFDITVEADGHYSVKNDHLDSPITGKVGESLNAVVPQGEITVLISELRGKPGAQFEVKRSSRTKTIDELQDALQLSEKGRQSGIIIATMQGSDRTKLITALNEVGLQYVRQNVERKAAEAEKTLAFLDTQLPQFKKQLEESEDTYNTFRNRKGTIALDEEAKLALQQTVELQTKLFEAQQQRREIQSKFTSNHPSLQTLNSQIAAWQGQITQLDRRIKNMPELQQDSLRLQRDVQVNNELYQSLLNNALQLRLVKEGKVGNVRILDEAVVPITPVKPRKGMIVIICLIFGLFSGVVITLIKNAVFNKIRSAQDIEVETGLSVYSTVPLSQMQKSIASKVAAKEAGMHVLAATNPSDLAVESLRSLRTSLQFALLGAKNNRILITGGTPQVGKSFISTNFAAIMAAGGKRTLLIDADMRRGYVNQFFGLTRDNGLSELITGKIQLGQATHSNVLDGLDLITTGSLPPNPAELLMSEAFGNLMKLVSEQYDIVIIDTPPVLVAADTSAAARHAGVILLVARAEQTRVSELQESVKRLWQAGTSVNGVIFNGIDPTKRYTGRHGYGYGAYKYANYDYAPIDNK